MWVSQLQEFKDFSSVQIWTLYFLYFSVSVLCRYRTLYFLYFSLWFMQILDSLCLAKVWNMLVKLGFVSVQFYFCFQHCTCSCFFCGLLVHPFNNISVFYYKNTCSNMPFTLEKLPLKEARSPNWRLPKTFFPQMSGVFVH